MRRYETSGGSPLVCIFDLLLICASFYAAAVLDFNSDPAVFFLYEGGIQRVSIAATTILIGLYFDQLYADVRVPSRAHLLQKLFEVFGIVLIAQSLVSYANISLGLPKWLVIYGTGFSLVSIFAWRIVYSRTLLTIFVRQRIVFVGNNPTIQEIAREIANRPDRGFEVQGFADERSAESLSELLRNKRPDRVVVGLDDRRNALPTAELLRLRYSGVAIEEASRTFESLLLRVSVRDLSERQLLFTRELNPGTNDLLIQRFMDLVISLGLLAVLSPILLPVVLGLRLSSKSAVFIRYTRVGREGTIFSMLRLRKSPGLGFLYRRFHMDALPELINVIRGEMSLIGPAPDSPESDRERSRSIPLYNYRHNVRPGMTGWAQIKLSQQERVAEPQLSLEFDLYYIKHLSQTLNAYILMTTLKNRVVWADQP